MLMSIKNVRKHFGKLEVLKDVNVDIHKGDVVVILGPSGSGKTTFLRCLNFLEQADSGEMDFAGMHLDLSHASQKEIATVRKKTAFVFQGYNLFANKTALENVMLGLTTGRGIPKADAEKTALGIPFSVLACWTGLIIIRLSCPGASNSVSELPGLLP